jgi:RHH-type proline utilization regulon transcriptional repressor/proline dehydrogenase/delta 1-pyrroline-5-carboxylate dehydrogenase
MYDLSDQKILDHKTLEQLRLDIAKAAHYDEEDAISNLLSSSSLTDERRKSIVDAAQNLVKISRSHSESQGTMDHFLHEFGLSNKEGVALMCLAEALLRVPDGDTADKLISEKIKSGNWAEHKGRSESLFVNASTWGLMLTGKFIELGPDVTKRPDNWFKRFVLSTGEPVVRKAINQAMKIMGGQYVLGRTIEEASSRGKKQNHKGTRFSFDMLGEGARTMADADRYFESYKEAIKKIGAANEEDNPYAADGISVKFSALHPRYEFAQHDLVMAQMLPRIKELAKLAREQGLGFTIDAEEADRLEISLDIFEALATDDALLAWDGLGIVVQAYQKRAPYVLDWLVTLARQESRKFMVRLVKGAYWDSEIKHAQEMGLGDYPVYTRKPITDLSYQICAERLMNARDVIYPQFATHNAYSVAMVLELARKDGESVRDFEFQRLHGMGGLLYNELQNTLKKPVNIRVYAPVGAHKDLLPYLVRRLLENGANSSFVNRFMDKDVELDELIRDTVTLVEGKIPRRHGAIPLPADILSASGKEGAPRKNAKGIDLSGSIEIAELLKKMTKTVETKWTAGPIIGGKTLVRDRKPVVDPSNVKNIVGTVGTPTDADVELAVIKGVEAHPAWDNLGGCARADILEKAADLMEKDTERLMAIIAREAGRTIGDGLAEVREAVDFCRYYAMQARKNFSTPIDLPGPTGERNELSLHGRGVFFCIAPWNFPLALFVGQVAAALASGNCVIAKPAETTPIIAYEAVKILHAAGVPGDVLAYVPGKGSHIGGLLTGDDRISGIAFTGSTGTAKFINRGLAARAGAIVPLIAETGGQNVMIVDSTALPEQVADDVLASAFQSAGQRCSALRVLFLQEEIADNVITMLKGGLECLKIGDPMDLSTDVGPVIDDNARGLLVAHAERMDQSATLIAALEVPAEFKDGTYFGPRIYEIESIDQLTEEVFGPILHIVRYKASKLDELLAQIRNTGFGLTMGIHSRIEGSAEYIFDKSRVGNTYVNRNIVGAVVGVQPFGGQGLSGTGPKAGGPHYMYRFATEKTLSVNLVATGGNTDLFCLED